MVGRRFSSALHVAENVPGAIRAVAWSALAIAFALSRASGAGVRALLHARRFAARCEGVREGRGCCRTVSAAKKNPLRSLPAVNDVLNAASLQPALVAHASTVVADAVRAELAE